MDNVNTPNQQQEDATDKKAVALKYNQGVDRAPRVIAKGRGHVAEHILAAAQKNTIPVYQNKALVNMLMALEIDREIPPELYKAIAEVMAYVYRMDASKGREERFNQLADMRRKNRR
ncbi:MAG: EscU/YscU/HrcU family type III secretion system export apparatus switch protein [Selenomonadaceae bacterium]|nr:EscU/YscU/HrcU family type III secretion system export apparatus switch protein [Selenomonadaceae bacterium]